MSKNYYINPSFSIIYHDENVVEFRSGIWNVVSHVLNDGSRMGNLAKIILEIDENGLSSYSSLSTKTGIQLNDCLSIINTLKEKNILIANQSLLANRNQPTELFSKTKLSSPIISTLSIIAHGELTDFLSSLLQNRFPNMTINLISEHELAFIEEAGEDLFRDNLLLEKTITKFETLFQNSILITISPSINPVFYLLLNKIAYESNIPWFFSAVDGPFIYVGPLFNQAFCYECLENRVLMNMKNVADYLKYKKSIIENKIKMSKPTLDESIKHLVCSLASMEIGSFLTTGKSIATHKMLSIYLPTMEFSYQKILRIPGCRVCGIDNALHGHQVHFDIGALLEL